MKLLDRVACKLRGAIVLLAVLTGASSGLAQPLGVPIEKFTGTWCGWCPYGAWMLDSIESRLGEKAVVLAWHFDDKFEIPAHDTLSALISNGGHPVLSIARTPVIGLDSLRFYDQHPWYVGALNNLPQEGVIDLDIASMSYDPKTKQVNLLVTLLPQGQEMPELGTARSVVVITEDDLLENQKLYKEEGGGSLPDLIDYPHRNVVRQVGGSVLGDSMWYAWGSGWFFHPYAFTLEGVKDPNKARVNVIVFYETAEGKKAVIAKRSPYIPHFGPQSVSSERSTGFELYPNPASSKLSVSCSDNTLLDFINVMGSRVLQARASNGEVDISSLQAGVYFVRAVVNGEQAIRRLIVR